MTAPTRLRSSHHQLMHLELLHPRLSNKELARLVGFSENYVSMVRNSDAYQAVLAQRRAQLNARVGDVIISKAARVAEKSLDLMETQLEEKGELIPLRDLRDTAAVTLKALGFGQPKQQQAQQTNVFVGASPEHLAEAREMMRRINERNSQTD